MNAENDGHGHGPRMVSGLSHRAGDGLTPGQRSDLTEAAEARQAERQRTDEAKLLAERVDTAEQARRRSKTAIGEPDRASVVHRATDKPQRGELRIPIRPKSTRPDDAGPLTEADLKALGRLIERVKRKDQNRPK